MSESFLPRVRPQGLRQWREKLAVRDVVGEDWAGLKRARCIQKWERKICSAALFHLSSSRPPHPSSFDDRAGLHQIISEVPLAPLFWEFALHPAAPLPG